MGNNRAALFLIKNSGDELPKARSLPLAGVNPLDLSMGSTSRAYLITTGACFNDWIKDVKNGISIERNVIPDKRR